MDEGGWPMTRVFAEALFVLSPLLFVVVNAVGEHVNRTRLVAVSGNIGKTRMNAAFRRRIDVGRTPTRWFIFAITLVSVSLAIVNAFVDSVSVLLIASMYVAISVAVGARNRSIRRNERRRYASLRPRPANAVVPRYVWLVAALASTSPLLLLAHVPDRPSAISCCLVALGGLVVLRVARLVANAPETLGDEDPAADAMAGATMRKRGALATLSGSYYPAFTFESLTHTAPIVVTVVGLSLCLAAMLATTTASWRAAADPYRSELDLTEPAIPSRG